MAIELQRLLLAVLLPAYVIDIPFTRSFLWMVAPISVLTIVIRTLA